MTVCGTAGVSLLLSGLKHGHDKLAVQILCGSLAGALWPHEPNPLTSSTYSLLQLSCILFPTLPNDREAGHAQTRQ